MCGLLALLFIAVPALEIFVIIQVGSLLGAGATLGVIVLTGLVGAALARVQGFAAVRQVQQALLEGERVGASLVAAALVLVAGVMMLTPGFITDVVGLLLLVPQVRGPVGAFLARRLTGRVITHTIGFDPRARGSRKRRDRDGDRAGARTSEPRGADDVEPPPPGVIDV